MGIDLSCPSTVGGTYREFLQRLSDTVCIHLLFKPHNPYHKFTQFNVQNIDNYGECIHGVIGNDHPYTKAHINYSQSKCQVIVTYNHVSEAIVDKIFIQPVHLKTNQLRSIFSGKKRVLEC